MKYTVRLKPFEDDSGNYGLTHIETYDTTNSFDAFWSADGIVHDVLEHWFEGQLRYFRGNSMCNVYGEMVASAIRVWMRHYASFDIFRHRNRPWVQLTYFEDTQYILYDFIEEEYYSYPVEPIHIPYQKNTKDYTLEGVISEYWYILTGKYSVKELHAKGIKLSLIQNAYRYGFRLAERLYGKYAYDGMDGRRALMKLFDGVLDQWQEITKRVDAKNMFIEESKFGLREIQFVVDTTKSVPRIATKLIDDFWNKYPIEALQSY
jgi:hypothetical protein